MQAKNLQALKRSNRATVLDFIRQHEPVSRRVIACDLDLSPTITSAAVSDLKDISFLHDWGQAESAGGDGRPGCSGEHC